MAGGVPAGRLSIEIVAEIARLQADLDKAKRMVSAASKDIGTSARAANDNLAGMGTSSKLAGHHLQNLTFQMNDLVVGLASGQKPMTVFMQQGAQIGQIMAQAGIGVRGLAAAIAGLAATTARFVLLNPYLLAIGVAVGTAMGAVKLFQSEVGKTGEINKFIAGLGLTKKELKELEGTTLTFGDVVKGLWMTIDDGLHLSSVFASLKEFAVDMFKSWLTYSQMATAGIYAGFAGTYSAIKTLWSKFPAMLADVFVTAANAAIRGIEWLLNKSIAAVNVMAQAANAVLIAIGVGAKFGQVQTQKLGQLTNSFAGAAAAGAQEIAAGYSEAYNQAMKAQGRFFQAVGANSIKAAKDRLRGQADALIGDRSEKAAKASKDRKKAMDEEAEAARRLWNAIYEVGAELSKLNQKWLDAGGFGKKSMTDLIPELGAKYDAPIDPEENDRLARQQEAIQGFMDMAAAAQDAAGVMAEAFGRVGSAIGNLISAQADYSAQAAEIAFKRSEGIKVEQTDLAALKRAENSRNAAAISGAKSLFKEKSTGYKVMTALEKIYAAMQLVNTLRAIATDTAHTASSVANSTTRAAADQAAGASKIFSQLGVFAFPIVAAMIALLAGLGVKGGKGGASVPSTMTSDYVQEHQGTGTVLGDSSAKSESIVRSLELMAANTDKTLEYSNEMVRSLRAIESGIGNLASAIARTMSLSGGAFDTSTMGLGTKTSGGINIPLLGGLFTTTTTKELVDAGVQFASTTLAEAIAKGIDGQAYQTIKKTKTSSGFLGIGGGTKTSYSTSQQDLDGGIERQVQLILGNLRDSVVAAAKVLGMDVDKALDAFKVEIGKVSFKDLKGDEIAQALEAVFSKVGDQMAGFAVTGLDQFQRAGEGLFETLMRLAKDYMTIDTTLKSIGLTFGAVGASSVTAREALIELAGGLDQFTESVAFYRDNFLTDAERLAIVTQSVNAEMQRLGLSSVKTIDQFKSVVGGIDLTTASGQALFTALMAVAPAFYQVATAADKAAAASAAAAQAAADQAAALAKTRLKMEVELLQATGRTAEATALSRQLELEAMDESLRGLQQQIWAAQDVAKARDNLVQAYKRERSEIEATANKFRAFASDLRDFRASLFATSDTMGGRNQAMLNLMRVGSMAAGGNEQALGDLPGVSRDFLTISKANAASQLAYQRDVAMVARYVDGGIKAADKQVSNAEKQLAALDKQVGRLANIDDGVLSVKQAIVALQVAQRSAAVNAETLEQARQDAAKAAGKQLQTSTDKIAATNEALALRMATVETILKRVERAGAIAVTTDDDAPVKVATDTPLPVDQV